MVVLPILVTRGKYEPIDLALDVVTVVPFEVLQHLVRVHPCQSLSHHFLQLFQVPIALPRCFEPLRLLRGLTVQVWDVDTEDLATLLELALVLNVLPRLRVVVLPPQLSLAYRARYCPVLRVLGELLLETAQATTTR